jgi:hypothetical protein
VRSNRRHMPTVRPLEQYHPDFAFIYQSSRANGVADSAAPPEPNAPLPNFCLLSVHESRTICALATRTSSSGLYIHKHKLAL